MEKNTTGRFLSALRRAKGLTQRELGDMLYVSDKTVSRWENDECAPDLNLLPAIADIFGISVDELLRGERNTALQSAAEAPAPARSGRQLQAILKSRYRKFKSFSFIPVGLAVAALSACIISLCGGQPWIV